ncbi:hypothetical protein BJ170DRAFT_632400 [Xylariales sp. AK1849]|nr:hypothetical protein BJ170DRAFT_632400 [Xylariales sp. AK1849]
MAGGPDFTKTFHKKPYDAISPLRPELSQAGRTVLITGGNDGIGYAAAQAFGRAGAAKVIIVGRRTEVNKAAASRLEQSLTEKHSSTTRVIGATCDISKHSAIERLWRELDSEGTGVDVLVLNATGVSAKKPILERGTDGIWEDYNINVRAQLDMVERFQKQEVKPTNSQKHVVMVSTCAIHDWGLNAPYPGYGLTKNAGTLVMQLIARDMPPEKMQIVSFNPGPVYTQNVKTAGWSEDAFPWNDPNLPGQFAVWAASPEASFLHGRFVWNEWDVDELKTGEIRKRIEEDPAYLQIGVKGL